MERQKYNKLILKVLSKLVNKHPDLRFGQILVNSEILHSEMDSNGIPAIDDPYYEESEKTWERMLMNKFAFYEQYN